MLQIFNGMAIIFANLNGFFEANTFGKSSPKSRIKIVISIIWIESTISKDTLKKFEKSIANETATIETATFTSVLPINIVTSNRLGKLMRLVK